MIKKHNNFIILLVLTVVSAILIVATSLNSEYVAPLRKGVGVIITPFQSLVSQIGDSAHKAIAERRSYQEILEKNEELNDTIDDLMMENTRLELATQELDRLRSLYQLDLEYGKYDKIGARVIAKDSAGWFNEFKIDKGSTDGLAVDMNVLANGGLIGIITEVGPNYSKVRSIIDDSSRVAGMSELTGDNCIVTGSLETYVTGKLILEDIMENAEIKDGDKIVTSNVSTKYLPGIIIGYATDIETDSNNITKSGHLIPAADFDSIQEVLVITTLKK